MNNSKRKRYCVIPVCKGERFDLVHKLPMDNERAKEWLKLIDLPYLSELPLGQLRLRTFICSRHFRKNDYKNSESTSLNKTALPTLNLKQFDNLEECRICNNADTVTTRSHISSILHTIDRSSNRSITSTQQEFNTSNPHNFLLPKNEQIDLDLIQLKQPNFNKIINDLNVNNIKQEDNKTTEIIIKKKLIKKSSSSLKPFKRKQLKKEVQSESKQLTTSGNDVNQDESSIIIQIIESPQKLVNDSINSLNIQQHKEQIASYSNNSHLYNIVDNLTDISDSKRITKNNYIDLVEDIQLSNLFHPIINSSTDKSQDLYTLSIDNLLDYSNNHRDNSLIILQDDYVTLKNIGTGEIELKINNFWLRDQCRCNKCYSLETFQRRQTIMDFPIDVKPVKYELQQNQLSIVWIDDHSSIYNISDLQKMQKPIVNQLIKNQHIFWTPNQIQMLNYARINLIDYLKDLDAPKKILTSLIKYGIAFIDMVPTNEEATEIIIRKLFQIQKTLFGEMWSFSDKNMEHSDTAYTNTYLGAHTDNTYFNDAAGLQIFHCIEHKNGNGGETLLIDGFNVLKEFRKINPDAYQRLCHYNVPAEYIENGKNHLYSAPIIKLHPITCEPEQLRFNLYDRATMNTIEQSEMLQFYKDLRLLANEIQSTKNEWWFKLNPGTIVLFDNWRVLHGRAAYTGERQMTGCYVSRTEFLSVARTLNVID